MIKLLHIMDVMLDIVIVLGVTDVILCQRLPTFYGRKVIT